MIFGYHLLVQWLIWSCNLKENLLVQWFIEDTWASSFLVACYATLHPALSVRPSVGPSVRPSHFTFFGFLRFLASLLLPKWWSDLNYGPCPPARDWGSRVSGLVFNRMPHKCKENLLLYQTYYNETLYCSQSNLRYWQSISTKVFFFKYC